MSLSRRNFLKTSGALIVTFSLAPKSTLAQRLDGASSNQVDGWLAINADGTITAFTGKCELGHGLYTAQTQLVAEELSVPFNRVKLIQCDTALTPGKKLRTPPLAPFRSRDFSLLWFGSFVSQAGSQMHVVAVSWQVYALTGNPLALGAIGVARIVPLVLLALGSGVLADALDRRKLMLFSQTAMMLCSAALAIASSLGIVTVWWIYIITALSSAAGTLGMPARQAIVPSLVPREHLSSALSLNIISWQAATILGPTLGGLIIAAWSTSAVYWIDAISFVAVIVALMLMRVGAVIGERRPVNLRAALEGFAFVRKNTLIWSTMLLDFLATLLGSATVLLPLFATDILNVGSAGVGLLYAAPSVGAVAASALLSVRGPLRHQGPILLVSVTLYGVFTAIFGLSTSFWLSP